MNWTTTEWGWFGITLTAILLIAWLVDRRYGFGWGCVAAMLTGALMSLIQKALT